MLASALGLPGAVLILATTAMLLGLPFGVDPLWQVETLTLPEAAALRDNGEVVRLIDLGEDPNSAGPVRQNFLRNDAQVVTPLEAAVGARRGDMVELLLQNGAVIDAAMWTRLICFAEVVDAGDVRDVLERRRPANASDQCADVRTPW
jgi:ankyrin repeat protein